MLEQDNHDVGLVYALGRSVLHHIAIIDIPSPIAKEKNRDLSEKLLLLGTDPLLEDDKETGSDDVVVHQIFSINDGKTALDIPKKRILFHGSKYENIIGILKHGLLITPPAAPSTGWNYGKGIYFSDQFSKAVGYASPFGSDGWD
eukprot:5784759-Ditylum_brightwellii.AAC.1